MRTFVLSLLFVLSTAVPAQASDPDPRDAAGCLDSYTAVHIGQTMRAVTRSVGTEAEISRRWSGTGARRFHERIYALCQPTPRGYDTLTVRFALYQGSWRVSLADVHVGPEEQDRCDERGCR